MEIGLGIKVSGGGSGFCSAARRKSLICIVASHSCNSGYQEFTQDEKHQ